MAMEVLLRRNIDGVGEVGEVVRVKPGYARNYLLPKGYAAIVTPDSVAQIEKDKGREAVRQAELAEARSQLAEKLSSLRLTIEARAGEDGHLYGSVGPKQVAAALAQQGYPIDARQIRLDPVRELGEYDVPVELGHGQTATLDVWVVQDAQEALEAAERAAAEGDASEGGGEDLAEAAPDDESAP